MIKGSPLCATKLIYLWKCTIFCRSKPSLLRAWQQTRLTWALLGRILFDQDIVHFYDTWKKVSCLRELEGHGAEQWALLFEAPT